VFSQEQGDKLNRYKNMINALEEDEGWGFSAITFLEIHGLEQYFHRGEVLWSEHIDELRQIINDESYTYDFQTDYKHSTAKTMPRIHRQSIIIMLYSLVETKHLKLCKILENANDVSSNTKTIRSKDLHGSGIERSMKYLTHCIGIDRTKINSEWIVLTELSNVRNSLVHQTTDEKKIKAVKQAYKKYSSNSVDEITEEFVDKMLSEMDVYFNKLVSVLNEQLEKLAKEEEALATSMLGN